MKPSHTRGHISASTSTDTPEKESQKAPVNVAKKRATTYQIVNNEMTIPIESLPRGIVVGLIVSANQVLSGDLES